MTRLLFALVLACVGAAPSAAVTLPTNFEETTVFSGLVAPTSVRFVSDGRVFVAEKSGLIKVFDNLSDSTPTIFADLRTSVHNFWDRGLLGLALHPSFPAIPYLYIAYTLDAEIGGVPPRWGTPGSTSDPCPQPPGANSSGCLVAGRLSRLEAAGNVMTGSEVVLLEDWCQQFPSHSIGSLTFGPDGALYMSAGDGASFTATDYGQFGGTGGVPKNPCGDPPVGVGGTQTSPAAEGGTLRSQDLQTLADPVGYDGTILRLDPLTGAALPDNPLFGSGVPGADRIVAYGLRNPFRMTVRPGTSELWLGDVGWNSWEEINRLADAVTGVTNFGWPCYEGNGGLASYAGLDICTNLYATPTAVTGPFFAYNHGDKIVAGEPCGTGSSSISGLTFYQTGDYPASYEGALFFTDYNRRCIWAILPGAGGEPDPATRFTFASGMAGGAVDLQIGPGGDLFFADYDLGRIRRISYAGTNQSPTAVAEADVTSGDAPLTVHFDGSASTDPDPGDVLTYAWDLDGDRVYDDSTALAPVFTYTEPGTYMVGLEVSDGAGGTDIDIVPIAAGNTAPSVTILAPAPDLTWQVNDVIEFSGSATDAQDGALLPSAFTWKLSLAHCPSDCHLHTLFDLAGVATGSFPAPDHDYPSSLELKVTVTDSGGLTDTKTVVLLPEAVDLQLASVPTGLTLIVGPTAALTPFTRRVIVGSVNSLTAPSPQRVDGVGYKFSAWTDGGAQSHDVTAPGAPRTYTAIFRPSCGDTALDAGEECDDGNVSNGDCCSSTCQFEPRTTVCRTAAGPCDRAETCTGTSAACPTDHLAPPNAVCRPGTQACDVAERCTGTSAACPADRFAPATVECRPVVGACDVPETCTGTSAGCPADSVAPASVVCRPGAGPCDVAETCTATSGACPSDVLASTTLVCRAAAAVCDAPETCTGTSAACPADGFAGAATVCREAAGPCDVVERCSGTGSGCPADGFAPATAECRPGASVCDVAEKCTGASAACPPNGFATSATECRPATGPCDVSERCTGASTICPPNGFASTATECRAATGPCDVAERCTGTTAACPGNAFAPATMVCRPAADVCDTAEACTGTSATCPDDRFASVTAVCRTGAGVCDIPETCTGTGAACPIDALAPATVVCRPGAEACDAVETCTGTGVACPADGFAPPTVVCRSASSPCDAVETCSGTSAACPADRLAPEGTECRTAAGPCDAAERCAGTSSSCPADEFAAEGSECRRAAGACDVAETCAGTSAVCPPDALVSEETECRAAAGPCDEAEQCSGVDAECPVDRFVPPETPCRAAGGECDVAEACTGASADCPVDAKHTTVCRHAAGECDAPESCDGTSDTCPADATFPDDDLDGLCNPTDPCTGGSRVANARLILGKLEDPGGDEKLVFKGDLALGAPLDPTRRGVRVLLEDATRKPIVDILVPGGVYDRNAKRGWRLSETGWKYINRAGLLGLRKIVLRTSGGLPGRLRFSIKGKNWNYRVAANGLPVRAILVLAPPVAESGECGEAAFSGPSEPRCGLSAGGKTLRCK